ncbi:MAG: hypothetical protein NVSMB18_09070 [Acetobacteraceae bacterium]
MATSRPFSALYSFGDSLSDAGNISILTSIAGTIPVSPPYYETSYGPFGTFSATVFSNGPVWVQDLSHQLGLGALRPSLYGGTDFAYGGAEANPTESGISGVGATVISLGSQLIQFETLGGGGSGALYTVSIGTNDLHTILQTAGLSLADMETRVAASVAAEMAFVTGLVQDGARHLLVLDAPDLGKMPVVTRAHDPAKDATASALANLYNVELNTQLETFAGARGVDLSILPLYSLLDQAVASPSTFQLANATDPAWTGSLTDSRSGTIVTTAPDTYLFWDQFHPTSHVQSLIAADAQSVATGGAQLYTAPTVEMTDVTTGASSRQFGTVGDGTVASLQGQFLYPGQDSVALRADAASTFLHGGPGDDALQATSGSNVLDGGTGSNFLVGATGADGGSDTFFTDARDGGIGWDTLVNFHAGDYATLWGYQPGTSALSWDASGGAAGYTGATLRADVQGTGSTNRSITFAGLSLDQTQHMQVSSGTVSGQSYLLLYNPGV